MFTVARECTQAFRSLLKAKGFVLTAVGVLAAGTCVTTVIFSITLGILVAPFPYRNANELIDFNVEQVGFTGHPTYTASEFRDFAGAERSFSAVFGYQNQHLQLVKNQQEDIEVPVTWLTPNALHVLGVPPERGRLLTVNDSPDSGQSICVISDKLWRDEFASDPHIVGSTLRLKDSVRTVVGVMPPAFQFQGASVWLPYYLNAGAVDQPERVMPFARLRDGGSVKEATQDFARVADQLVKSYPGDFPEKRYIVSVSLYVDEIVGEYRVILYTAAGATGLLLLIACCNVASLLLVRVNDRSKELAIRTALGATKTALIRQLYIESTLICLLAIFVGTALSFVSTELLKKSLTDFGLPIDLAVTMRPQMFVFAFTLLILTTLACGIAPSMRILNQDEDTTLSEMANKVGQGVTRGRLRAALVVMQVTLSIILLVGTDLLVHTFYALAHVDLGFNSHNVLICELRLPEARQAPSNVQEALFERILQRIRRTPGVVEVAPTLELPPEDGGTEVRVASAGNFQQQQRSTTLLAGCGEEYFKVLGRPMKEGRVFSSEDLSAGRRVVVINQAFVRRFFHAESPVGRRIVFDFQGMIGAPDDPSAEVVGVVADAKNQGVRQPVAPQVYYLYRGGGRVDNRIALRASVDPLKLVESIRHGIEEVDPGVRVKSPRTIDEMIDRSTYAAARIGLLSIGSLTVIAVVLVSVGLFSLISYIVSLRTKEIGVRISLGAKKSQIVCLLLRHAATLVAIGVVAGVVVSTLMSHLVEGVMWGISGRDPLSYIGAVAMLAVCSFAAVLGPVWRATRLDPAQALRRE
jgi:predicted permease